MSVEYEDEQDRDENLWPGMTPNEIAFCEQVAEFQQDYGPFEDKWIARYQSQGMTIHEAREAIIHDLEMQIEALKFLNTELLESN